MRPFNCYVLTINWQRVDQNKKLFQAIFKRGSYVDAAYSFSAHSKEYLESINLILFTQRRNGTPQFYTEKKIKSFVSRYNALIHRALRYHPTHNETKKVLSDFQVLIKGICESSILPPVKVELVLFITYFYSPYKKYIDSFND